MIKFDILCEKFTSELVKEGRTRKTDRYSNIEIDASSFENKLKAGDLDELVKVWSTKSWMGGLPEDKLKSILTDLAKDLTDNPASSYTDLIGTIENQVSKATNRKDLRVKITRVVANLLTDDAYGLTKISAAPATKEITQTVSRAAQARKEIEKDQESLSPIEQRIYDRISNTEDKQESANVIRQELAEDPDTEDMTDEEIRQVILSLVDKNKIKREGNILTAVEDEKTTVGTPILDIDDEEDTNPFEYDRDVESAYREAMREREAVSDNY
jgi:hypothetical protein